MARPYLAGYTPPSEAVASKLDEITRLLRVYLDRGKSKAVIQDASQEIVELRGMFTHDEGQDWRGQSGEYQHAIAEVWSRLELQQKERNTVQSLVRFHISNILAEKLSPEEKKRLNIKDKSPNARKKQGRDLNAAAASAVGIQAGANETVPRVLAVAANLVENAAALSSETLTKKERLAVKALISDIRKGVDALEETL